MWNVLNTNMLPVIYQSWDYAAQYVPGLESSDRRNSPALKNEASANVSKHLSNNKEAPGAHGQFFRRLFNPKTYIQFTGFEVEEDGTTNNISAYFEHVRENVVGKKFRYFMFYYFLATCGGAVIYFVSAFALNGQVSSAGDTFELWDVGVACIYCQFCVHTAMWAVEARSWHWKFCLFLVISTLLFMPGTVTFNDGSWRNKVYYKSQWAHVYSSPLFHLVAFLCTFVIVAPRYIWITF